MDYFVGLDVSLRSCALCVVDTKGKVVLERELACEVDDIAACLSDFEFPIERIGLEAGTMSQHLYFGLQAAGFDVVLHGGASGKRSPVCDAKQDRQK